MKPILKITAALGLALLGGCATYTSYPGYYYDYGYYGAWGYEGGDGRGSWGRGGGRSEPGNESGMYPARPSYERGGGHGGGGSRGGEAGR